MEYTLKDAFDTLKDTQMRRQKEIEDFKNEISKLKPIPVKDISSEKVEEKQQKFCENLLNHIKEERPKDFPVLGTSDLHIQILTELKEEIENAGKLSDHIKSEISSIKNDISFLEKKKSGFEKMKEAYLNTEEMIISTTYEKEYATTKRMFHSVRDDLHNLIEELFPENEGFANFLQDLTKAYKKGGDDMYIEIEPNVLEFANYLVEAGVALHHRNDKRLIKLIDIL